MSVAIGTLGQPVLRPDLVERARAGDADALGQVLEELATALLPTAAALAGRAEAGDLLSDALSRVCERLGQLCTGAAVIPRARQIMLRLYIDERRRRSKDQRIQVELRQRFEAPETLRISELRDAVLRLRAAERTILVLHYWTGLTLDECGEELGIPAGTVRSRLHGALTKLRLALGGPR